MKRIILLFSFIACFTGNIHASHIAGCDLSYACIGGNNYLITLTFYRDCSGIDEPTSVTVDFSSSCGNFTVTLNKIPPVDGVEVTPVCPGQVTTCNGGSIYGLQQFVYQGQATLVPCNNWVMSYTLCCRNPSNTISSPTSADMYIPATLNNVIAPCNSSPTFSNPPSTIICNGQQFCYNHGALDPDGDSLVYTLVTPYDDGPGGSQVNVSYISPYTAQQPLPSSPPVTLDPITGDICMTPTANITTVLAVLVQEYRMINGVPTLIGSVLRDMQLTVVTCNNQIPTLSGMSSGTQYSSNDTTYAVVHCVVDTVFFNIFAYDPNVTDVLTISWNNGIPSGTFTITNNGTNNPSGHFFWVPGPGTISNVPYCFTVSVVDNHCPYVGTQTFSYCITISGIPMNLAATDTVICAGDSTTITVSGPPNVNYTWDPPTGLNTSTGSTVIAHPTATTTYIVTGVDNTSCSTAIPITIYVNPNPVINITPPLSTICGTSSSTLTAHGADTYVWSPAGGLSSTTGSVVDANPASTTTYVVTGTLNGCTSTANATVAVNNNLTLAVSPGNPNICIGDSIGLTVMGADSYIWSPSNHLSADTGSTVIAFPVTTTTYIINGTSAGGCTGVTQVTVTVNNFASLSFSPANPIICEGESVSIQVFGDTAYYWSPPAGLSATTGDEVVATPLSTTTYTVTVNPSGCPSTASVTVTVIRIPMIDFSADTTEGCEDLTVQFFDHTVPTPVSWTWDFDDGTGHNPYTHIQNPVHIYPDGGKYDVTLLISSAEGCKAQLTIPEMITVFRTPMASFYPDPQQTWILEPHFNFIDESINASEWDWDFGEPEALDNHSMYKYPDHTYADTGNYTVTLIATSPDGCRDTVVKEISIKPLVAFYAPNAFTPNNDGRNDIFYVKGTGIVEETFVMRIFNRWGQEVYFGVDINSGWDGRAAGSDQISREGVYCYTISFNDILGDYYKYKGIINLIK